MQEKELHTIQGGACIGIFLLNILFTLGSLFQFFTGFLPIPKIIGLFYLIFLTIPLFLSIKMIKDNEAKVYTLFGKYHGTIKTAGLHCVNPLAIPITFLHDPENPASIKNTISLKINSLNNEVQKINDKMGNPIEIGVMVVWKVENPTKAVFEVDNFQQFLSDQTDILLRSTICEYAYDFTEQHVLDKKPLSLRENSLEIAEEMRVGLQEKVSIAGLSVLEIKITQLSYAPEIASAMLQKQQASAILDAKKLIVEGAVDMVKMALEQLDAEDIVTLDDERKAAMVSNLLVILCANKDPQPIVNSGSIY